MPIAGEWTVDGSAADLRALSTKLRITGQSGLKKNMTKAIRVATLPARQAVKAELRAVMPHRGGLNDWLAQSSITSAVLTGAKSAGVVVRATKRGHDLPAVNRTGRVRHPVYGNTKRWSSTDVPDHWWEHALEPFGVGVRQALVVSMNVTAREAGFI